MNRELPSLWSRLAAGVRDICGKDPVQTQTDYFKRYAGAAGQAESDRLRARLASYAEPAMPDQRSLDEALNEAVGLEPAVRRDSKGTTYFAVVADLDTMVHRLQVMRQAAVASSRMSGFTFRKLRPKGVLGHACKLDDFMAPYLCELTFNDESRCYIQVNGSAQ